MGIIITNNVYLSAAPRISALRPAAVVRATAGVAASPVNPQNGVRDIVSLSPASDAAFALHKIGASLDAPAVLSNALATADEALSRICGHLGNVQSTLSVTSPADGRAGQQTIDSSIQNIDQITSSTKFAGKPLLDGTFTASLNGSALSIPSCSSTSLELRGLSSESAACISTVAAAITRLSNTRSLISAFQSNVVQPAAHAGQDALEQLIESPTLDSASSASTTALLLRAQTVVSPSESASSSFPQASHVLGLLS